MLQNKLIIKRENTPIARSSLLSYSLLKRMNESSQENVVDVMGINLLYLNRNRLIIKQINLIINPLLVTKP